MIRILSVIYLMIICQPVLCQMIADPYGKGNTESYGFILGLTEVEYEFNNHTNDVEVERTTLGFEYHFEGDDDGVQLFTQVAYTLDAEYRTLDGSGFSIGGGGHAFVAKIEEARLEGYIFANYIKEQYSGNSINTELDMLDIHLAPTIRFLANKTTQFYGALDMALYSDGSIETTPLDIDGQLFARIANGALDSGAVEAKGVFDSFNRQYLPRNRNEIPVSIFESFSSTRRILLSLT